MGTQSEAAIAGRPDKMIADNISHLRWNKTEQRNFIADVQGVKLSSMGNLTSEESQKIAGV
jgi:hypothetical protein